MIKTEKVMIGNVWDLPLVLAPKDVAKIMSIDERTVRELIIQGKLPGEKFGSRYKIPTAKLLEKLGLIGVELPQREGGEGTQ
jgi:excisionase family DNA binding protein